MAVEDKKTLTEKVAEIKKIEPWYKSFLTKWSQQINSIVVALPLAYAGLPDKWQDAMPDSWIWVFSALGMAAFITRNLKQPTKG